jgi:hypothetical protein
MKGTCIISGYIAHSKTSSPWGESVVLFDWVGGVGRLLFVDVVNREESELDKLYVIMDMARICKRIIDN